VNTVVPETGAGKAGLQPGDVITTIDGHDVRGFDSLTILVAYKKVGQTIDLVFKRGDKTLSATATLGPRPDVLP
jgi:serine protease Do